MILTAPMPFHEALDAREVKRLLPTELRTDLLSTVSAQVRERAMFSAGVTNAEFLQRASDAIDDLASGRVDRGTKRAELRRFLASISYQPALGEAGSVTDLSSDTRLNLILDTNLEMAQGYGRWVQGQDADILDQWPAQELVRVRQAEHPREWLQRWRDAGGTVFPGDRMIALKNDRIWTNISRFGLPYPPFDFNSGMDVEDVDRDTAIELELIDRDTEIFPQSRDFNLDLQATPEVRDASLRSELEHQLDGIARFVDDVLVIIGGHK